MAVDREDIEKLHAEAKRIRKNFRYIQKDLKRSPENIDLLRQRDHLKKRYGEIQVLLREAREAGKALPEEIDEGPESNVVDMSIFEPKPFEIPAAVNPTGRRTAKIETSGARITVKDVRNIISIVVLVVVLPFFYLYFVKGMRFYEVPTRSMEPTLMPGDRIVALRPSHYQRGDIVVLPDPKSPGDYLVKRLVAFAGDTVEIANGNLFVNGQPINEPYIPEPAKRPLSPSLVADGEVYLLGDNRNNSEDSRAWGGGVPIDNLIGRVQWIYSPAGRRGGVPDQTPVFSEVPAPQS